MALKFKCPECGSAILVKYLKIGEEARCENCWNTVAVPESSEELNQIELEAYEKTLREISEIKRLPIEKTETKPEDRLKSETLGKVLIGALIAYFLFYALTFFIGVIYAIATDFNNAAKETLNLLVGAIATLLVLTILIIYMFWVYRMVIDVGRFYPEFKYSAGGALALVVVPFVNMYGMIAVYIEISNKFDDDNIKQLSQRIKYSFYILYTMIFIGTLNICMLFFKIQLGALIIVFRLFQIAIVTAFLITAIIVVRNITKALKLKREVVIDQNKYFVDYSI